MKRPGTAPHPAGLVTIAAIITISFMGSVIVTPLYSLYQRKLGFGEITLTLIYAAYVIGNVVALLVFGQISDQIGRKPVAIPALGLAVVSAVLFLVADGIGFLFAARVLVGIAVGVASGTGTAWLADEVGADQRARATLFAATANVAGIALGPLLGGLLAEYAPHPLVVPFVVYIGLVVLLAGTLIGVPATRRAQVDALREVRVRPRVGVPREQLSAFTVPAVAGFVVFSLAGLYFAIIPGLVRRDLHYTNVAVGGYLVFELGVIAALVILGARRLRPAVAMSIGLASAIPAVGLVVAAQALRSMPLLVAATALAGIVLGFGYRGSLQVVNDIAPDDRRAEMVSSYFIACFVGNSVPVIGVGVLETLTSPLTGSIAFAVVLAVLALVALAARSRSATRLS